MGSKVNLLLSPIPVNKTAHRVIKPAAPEDVWAPIVKTDHRAHSREVLNIRPIPAAAAHMQSVIGKKRDRLTVIGLYGADESTKKSKAWVVRCDCGNYETRSTILRWIGTHAPDMCLECRARVWKKGGQWSPSVKAVRDTKEAV